MSQLPFTICKIVGVVGAALWLSGCGAAQPVADQHCPEHQYGVSDAQFLRTMGGLLEAPTAPDNSITPLINGDQIFPEMLGAIRSAERTITFETYIYWSSEIGEEFAQALIERAQAGVKVHLVIDAIGSDKFSPDDRRRMEESSIQIVRYNPVERLLMIINANRVNYRMHRKILVVDGKVAFIGGVGVADEWRGNAQDPQHWRDTHYRVEGPIVAHLQGVFADTWLPVKGQVLDGSDYFPPLAAAGSVFCQVFASSPQDGSASMELMFLLSVAAAEESIYIATPYFVPGGMFSDVLIAARKRGVKVKVVVPGAHIDMDVVRTVSQGAWGPLLEAGVEIYEYQPTMYHGKLLVVDGLWTSIGSANVDPRSFRLSDEVNLNVYDAAFAKSQIEMVEQDIAQSKQITAWGHEQRSLMQRVEEMLSKTLEPLL